MKKILTLMFLRMTISILGQCQTFVSDSVCYENLVTGKKIRCETPTLDPGTETYYRDLWEIERDGDFIKIVHWLMKPKNETYLNAKGDTLMSLGSAIITHFGIQYKDKEEITYVSKKIKRSSQVFQGNASVGSNETTLALNWQLYDLNNDGTWDRLVLGWLENNSNIIRVIYCHIK